MTYYSKTWPAEVERREDAALGIARRVDPVPTRRRIQALIALGWSAKDIGLQLGITQQAMSKILHRSTWIYWTTEQRVRRVYKQLRDLEPEDSDIARRNRAKARREGWKKPDDWADIETGELAPRPDLIDRDRFDEVEVDYMLAGHWRHALSVREKAEVIRRWTGEGRSEAALCRLTGWREGRYSHYEPTNA